MLRVGVVGAGDHSRRNHGPALERCRNDGPADIDLRAVCDLDRDRALEYARRFGFEKTYGDFDRMLRAESLDALIAVTPVDSTREIAGELLSHGLPVLIEKPPGDSPDEARELRQIAAEHGTPHMVSFNRRFNPALVRAQAWIADHASDRPPTHCLSRLLRTGRFDDDFVKNTGIHAVDTARSVLGRPTQVCSRRWGPSASSARNSTRCAASATFTDGSAQFVIVSDAGTHAETYELFGPDYVVKIDVADTSLRVTVDGETSENWRAPDDDPRYVRNGSLGETRAFLREVARGGELSPTLADTVPSVDLAASMAESETRDFSGS